jgi:hypothetical protein
MDNEFVAYDALHIPPNCVSLAVYAEVTPEWDNAQPEVQRVACYYDAALGQFRNAWGPVRGTVKCWRVAQ